MRFSQPSPNDRYFETPSEARPFVALGITAAPHSLPPHLRTADTGVTRWFDLVMGFALDNAARRGVEPWRVTEALAAGDLIVRSFFFRAEGDESPEELTARRNDQAACIGGVLASKRRLVVSGGSPALPPAAVMYRRRDSDLYLPSGTQFVRDKAAAPPRRLKQATISDAYVYRATDPAAANNVPDEFRGAYDLGKLAETVTAGLDAGAMAVRSNVASIGFVGLREPEQG